MAGTGGKGRRPAVVLVDPASITQELEQELRTRAKEAVDAEVREKTADVLYAQYLEEERRARQPLEELKTITLDMAGHSDRIMLDGLIFFHGMTYKIGKGVYESLREIVSRGWDHEGEVGFANRGRNIAAPRPRDTIVSARLGTQSAPRQVAGA